MCLLINHPAETAFDYDDIADFYDYNQDGIGIMYAEDGVLYVKKILPANESDAWAFYKKHAQGRDCVIHLRMKTHGDIDLTNCHPYEVLGDGSVAPIYMAHNGILSTGNAKGKSKSDTWWFIEDYLKPILTRDPGLVFEPAFIALLEETIGSGNKFAFMNHEGRVAIVNERAFVTYKGALLSNTYAWSAHKGGYGIKAGRYGGYANVWDDFDWGAPTTPRASVTPLPYAKGDAWGKEESLDDYDPVGAVTDVDVFVDLLLEALDKQGLARAYNDLTYVEMEEFYEFAGEDAAYQLIDEIENGYANDTYVLSTVTNTLLRAAANA